MSMAAMALNELPKTASHKTGDTENKTLADLGKNDKVVVNKVDNKTDADNLGDEFMSESEFGPDKSKNLQVSQPANANNTTTITVSTSNAKPTINMAAKSGNSGDDEKLDKNSNSDNMPVGDNTTNKDDNELDINLSESTASDNEAENDSGEDEKSAAELVAAAAAQIANKTLKKNHGTDKNSNKTIKSTGKLLASGKQEQIMKKAMLMMNESGRLNVITDEPTPSIVKLNTPVNKAQIKLRTFRQNFEKELADMRRKTPLQLQTLKAELANIEFAEIGNKNIMAGLLELIDDHELKMLTIEKMLKYGDITLSF